MVGRWLNSLACGLLILALFYAPWAYGATTLQTQRILVILLGVALALWTASWVAQRRVPGVPLIPAAACAGLVLLGWWMVWNGHFLHDDAKMAFIALKSPFPNLPGSTERALSAERMTLVSVLLGTVLMACDAARSHRWRKRLLSAVALAGFSIAIFGLIQRSLGAPGIFWHKETWHGFYFFSTFRYHANAGAYLNMVLPVLAGLWVLSIQTPGKYIARGWWLAALACVLTATVVNASRGAGVVTVLLGLIFLGWQSRFFLRLARGVRPWMLTAGALVCATALTTVVLTSGVGDSVKRWSELPSQLSNLGGRLPAQQAWLHILPHSGWFGTGAGTFRAVSSYFKHYGGEEVEKFWWKHAHQDYLETVIEWGYIGGVLWAVLVIGGMVMGWLYFKKAKSHESRLLSGGMLLAIVGALLHALYDFPLQIPAIELLFVLYIGLMWGSYGWKERYGDGPYRKMAYKNRTGSKIDS